jgi:hypothetical protein
MTDRISVQWALRRWRRVKSSLLAPLSIDDQWDSKPHTFGKEKPSSLGFRILVRHLLKRSREHLWSTIKLHRIINIDPTPYTNTNQKTHHTNIRLYMSLPNRAKHPIPIRSPKMRRRTQQSDRIPFCTDILHVDIIQLVFFEFGG